ncbi:MAG: hypothetical protein AAB546_00580 [Patescibacteria group bacterium]
MKKGTLQDYLLVIYGYEQIYGFDGGGIERVRNEVSEFNFYSLLETLSKIVVKLYSKNGFSDRNNQVQLVRDIFAGDLEFRKKILEAISKSPTDNWVLFAEQPILNLYKVILEKAKKEGGRLVKPEDVGLVGKWLLILSDVCMPDTHSGIVLPVEVERERLREFLARQSFFMVRERLPYRLARFKDLFLKIEKLHPEFDIKKLFSTATSGIELNDYLSLCFYLLVSWVNNTTQEPDITKQWITCKRKYFEQAQLDEKEVDAVVNLLLLDVDNYESGYQKVVSELLGGTDIYPYNFLQLRQCPFIPFNKECFVCPAPDFLMDKATEGIYWLLENYLRKIGDKRTRDDLPTVWGNAFEAYIHERLGGAFGNSYIKNPSANSRELFDGVIVGSKAIFCVETKYAHWTYKARLTGKKVDMEPTLKQLFSGNEKVKGLGQITRTIKEIESGKSKLPIEIGNKKLIPLLIVGETVPMDAYNRKYYEDFSKLARSFYENYTVMPFIILDAEEVETLEAMIAKHGAMLGEDILFEYSEMFSKRNADGYVREVIQFKNFLNRKGYLYPNNFPVMKKFDAIANIATKKGFPRAKLRFRTGNKTRKTNK